MHSHLEEKKHPGQAKVTQCSQGCDEDREEEATDSPGGIPPQVLMMVKAGRGLAMIRERESYFSFFF